MAEDLRREGAGSEPLRLEENEGLFKLGDALRRRREELGLAMTSVAAQVPMSQSRLSLLERGLYPDPSWRDVNKLGEVLGLADMDLGELRRLLDVSTLPANSMDVIQLRGFHFKQSDIAAEEARTRRTAHFAPTMIPGLLQLPDYSQQLFARIGLSSTAARDAMVARQERQRVLADSRKSFRFVMHESVLYTVMGSAKSHLDQLNWLSMIGARPNVELRVIPIQAGNDIDAMHGFTVHDKRLVTAELMLDFVSSTRPTDITHFLTVFDRLRLLAPEEYGGELGRAVEVFAQRR